MFFEFHQNNSGGHDDIDPNTGIVKVVVIEAPDCETANNRAESIGLYFDGCDNGRDCLCCGDRWYRQWSNKEGSVVPIVYGKPVDLTSKKDWYFPIAIHYADGRCTWITGAD